MQKGYMYILSNKNRTVLYVGATKNLIKRIMLHKKNQGARFTKMYNVYDLIYFEEFEDYHEAFSREKQIKNWHSEWKWNLVKSKNLDLKNLYLDL